MKKLSHINQQGLPAMVDVSPKSSTLRHASARATVVLGKEIIKQIQGTEIITKKGPVFQTAIIAGVMGAKQTSSLIPFCHQINLDNCQVAINVVGDSAVIDTIATTTGKTGVEMEALTAATIAALTIYDMCKAMSHDIRICEVMLMKKEGGKKSFTRKTQ